MENLILSLIHDNDYFEDSYDDSDFLYDAGRRKKSRSKKRVKRSRRSRHRK